MPHEQRLARRPCFGRLYPFDHELKADDRSGDVFRSAKVFAGEHATYNDVIGLNRLGRVNYSEACSSEDRTNTNFVESFFFSRIQRAKVGIHHRFPMRYLDWFRPTSPGARTRGAQAIAA